MKQARWLVPLVVLLSWHPEVSAQVLMAPFVPGYGPGFGFNYRGRNLAFSGFVGAPVYGYGFRPIMPYYPYGYGYPVMSSVTYIYSPPPPIVMMPPIVINNNQTVVVGGGGGAGVDVEDDGRFLKIIPRQKKPAEEAPAERPPMRPAEPKERPAPKKEPAAVDKPKKPEPKPDIARPARKPKDEAVRLVALGKEAFATGQHGLAERRFQKAIELAADQPMSHFLLAQAQFARGKYREAVESIQAGMRRDPDWPGARFDPRDLYGDDPEDFQEHLKLLEDTLARFPNDPSLLFLQAHQLWFTDKRDEARMLFQRAARVAPDRTFIDRFLKPGLVAPVARR